MTEMSLVEAGDYFLITVQITVCLHICSKDVFLVVHNEVMMGKGNVIRLWIVDMLISGSDICDFGQENVSGILL